MNAPTQQQNDNSVKFPPGRIVQGDLYEAQTKDMKGNPLLSKSGQNAGQPMVRYFFAVAIPKTQALWWNEQWGAKVNALAAASWPQGQTASPKFAWKIEDGDNAEPNFERQGRKNCDNEGFRGCWIVKFTSGFAPKIFDTQLTPMTTPGLVKRGFWVEVLGSVNGNGDATKPGIHMNHNMVCYRAPDKEISNGPDPRSAGFGQDPLPAGVSAAPASSQGAPPMTPAPASAATPYTPPATPGAAPTPASAPAPVAVAPSPTFLAPPVPGAVPAVPAAAPAVPAAPVDPLGAPAGYRMTNPAGAPYAQFAAGGWTNDMMLSNGHMVKL